MMGLSIKTIKRLNRISRATIFRYVKRYKESRNVLSRSEKYGDSRGRDGYFRYDLDEIAEIMSNRLNKRITDSALRYWMKKLKMSRKKLWQYAREASLAKEIAFWQYMAQANHHINQFIFIDECHVNSRDVNRPYGWSLRGQRAVFQQIFGRNDRMSVLAGCDTHGIVDYTILDGGATGHDIFSWCIRSLLAHTNPYPGDHSVILADNHSIHKYLPFQILCDLFGVQIVYIPAYSPHLNPIENFFNILKLGIKRNRISFYFHPLETIVAVIEQYRTCRMIGSYRNAGYLNLCRFDLVDLIRR